MINKGKRWYFSSFLKFPHQVNLPRVISGVPTNGTSGTGAGTDGPGSIVVNYATGYWYTNIGTKASPTWQPSTAGLGATAVTTAITASGAIAVRPSASYAITKAGVAAMTLAAPVSGAPGTGDDGVTLDIFSTTANAHTITGTGLFLTGAAFTDVITFNAAAGASVRVRAYGAKWAIIAANGVSFS